MKTYFYIVFLLSILVSCGSQVQSLPFDVDKANKLIQTRPDSIANILENEINPELLSDSEKADYWLLLAQTHASQKRSLINDSLINFTVDYYKKNNSPYLSQAYRLAALYQLNWSGSDNTKEIELFKKAIEVAENSNDTIGMYEGYGSLASIYFIAGEFENSISTDKKYLRLLLNDWDKMIVAYRIACEYTYLNNPDSCFRYFKEAINVAQTNGYDREYDIVRNYADAYNYFDKSDKAIEILRELDKKYPQKLKAYFSYTNAWLNLNQLDSAKVYLDYMGKNLIPPPTANDYFVVSFIVNSLQSAYNAKTGKPSEILGIARIADNSMHHLRNNISVDKERVFLQNKLERDKSNLKIEKQQQLQTYLIIIIAILLITAIIIFVYQRKILKKERLIQLAKERLQENTVKLYENENTIKENENIIKDLTSQLEENSDIKEQLEEIEQIKEANKSLLKQNGLLSKEIDKYTTILTKKESEKAFEEVSRQNIVLQEREKFLLDQLISNHDILSQLKYSPKYINDEQWATIVNIINVLYNNYTVRLQADFPNLTEDDIRYSCLIKLRLSTSTIATLMAVSPPSVTKRKQRIKERMNKQNSGTLFKELSLENYLWSY